MPVFCNGNNRRGYGLITGQWMGVAVRNDQLLRMHIIRYLERTTAFFYPCNAGIGQKLLLWSSHPSGNYPWSFIGGIPY